MLLSAEPDYRTVIITPEADSVVVRLPLTDVTGKVRVKERNPAEMGKPVPPLMTVLDDNEYLEWQIGYDTRDPHHPSLAPQVSFQRRGETKYGCELSKILAEAYRLGIVTAPQLREVRKFLEEASSLDLEQNARLKVSPAPPETRLPGNFSKLVEEIPMFVKETDQGRVEIQLKQRQRGVGNQAMVYVCLKIPDVRTRDGKPRPAGPARSKETVTYVFNREHSEFLLDIVRAFGLASAQHSEDLTHIIDCILGEN